MKSVVNTARSKSKPKVRVAAFFAGAGGLDLGFDQAGFDVVYATDFIPQCTETIRANSSKSIQSAPEVVCADIRTLKQSDLPSDIDFVIGGPPCQSFSASGRRAGGAAGTLDSRGTLFEAYCRVL
ncbi:DNA cytosine methyltransferase, partial [Stenotrophomonas maltophilia]